MVCNNPSGEPINVVKSETRRLSSGNELNIFTSAETIFPMIVDTTPVKALTKPANNRVGIMFGFVIGMIKK